MLFVNFPTKTAISVALSCALLGCGGGGGSSNDATSGSQSGASGAGVDTSSSSGSTAGTGSVSPNTGSGNTGTVVAPPPAAVRPMPASKQDATRFLTQATFGPTDASVNELMAKGYEAWIDGQFGKWPAVSYKQYWDTRNNIIKAGSPAMRAHRNEISFAFWTNAIQGSDQLRQRVALALSEIFVISDQDSCGEQHLSGVASYFDMLGRNAFGSYRDLLQLVTLHPVMGCYLSHLHNQKEDVISGRVPDENYAREVMQLFSIGLVQLNVNGSPKLGSGGQALETYTAADVSGLAKVFTGWSWDCPSWPSANCFNWGADNFQSNSDMWAVPMRPYAKFHSTSEKRFLGVVVPPQSNADPQASLKVALDTLAKHPNVGPFLGKQLIQRLVTSNPSPAYVQRVATAFTASNGSMQAMIKAILMDPEARDFAAATRSPSFGKVREPLLRVSALLRAYTGRSASGAHLIWSTNDPGTGLGQSPLEAPSVFNYFRPGYTPPNSNTSNAGLAAPEMQILNETSAAGYVNYVRDGLSFGFGICGYANNCQSTTPRDVQLDFQSNPNSDLLKLATNPEALVENTNQRLMYGTMPDDLRADILAAVKSVYVGTVKNQSAEDASATAKKRIATALLLTMASPEFQVQK